MYTSVEIGDEQGDEPTAQNAWSDLIIFLPTQTVNTCSSLQWSSDEEENTCINTSSIHEWSSVSVLIHNAEEHQEDSRMAHVRRRIHACHMRRRMHACHMRRTGESPQTSGLIGEV